MSGAIIEEIKSKGDWASETVYQYLKTPFQVRVINELRAAATLAAVGSESQGVLGPGPGERAQELAVIARPGPLE